MRLIHQNRWSAPEQPRGPGFRADVQGLRAIAVLLVIGAHTFGNPRGGFIGVDVFFVISGYLITGILIRERERTNQISIRSFYERRARRILPAAVVVLLVTDVVARAILNATRAHQTIVDSLWSLGFLANVHFAAVGTSYFDALRPPSAVQQYWSLAVEEQFYLVWPCALILSFLVARRLQVDKTRAVVGSTALILTIASFAFCLHATNTHPSSSYFSASTRAWELGVGALTAIAQPGFGRLPRLLRLGGGWLGVALVVAGAFIISPATPFPGYAAALPVLATALVLGAGDVSGGVGARRALGNPVPQYLGTISYSLYLWHWPAIIFAKAYFGAHTAGYYGGALVATFVLSVLSFHLIEDPVRRSTWLSPKPVGHVRRRADDWVADNERVLAPLAIIVLLSVGWGGYAWAASAQTAATVAAQNAGVDPASLDQDPAAGDSTTSTTQASGDDALTESIKASLLATSWGPLDPSLDHLTSAAAPEWKVDDCLDVVPRKEAQCVYGARNGSRVAVVVGDSIAISYMQAIRAALPGDWKIQVLTLHQCPMLDEPTKEGHNTSQPNTACTTHREFVMQEITRIKPDLVIEANSFDFVTAFVNSGTEPQNIQRWQAGMTRTLTSIATQAKRVVLIGAPPTSENLQECVAIRSTPQACAREVSGRWLAVRGADQAASSAAGTVYVDPLDWFCYRNRCPAVIGSTPVYWDGIHMTAPYSKTLGVRLAPALLGEPATATP